MSLLDLLAPSRPLALLEHALSFALDETLRDLRVPHRRLDVGVPEKLLAAPLPQQRTGPSVPLSGGS